MLSYWKAPNGPVERVYLQVSPDLRIYGQRIAGDQVAWRGENMEVKEAERRAHESIGSLPSWSALRQMAGRTAVSPSQSAIASNDRGSTFRPPRTARPARTDGRRPQPKAIVADIDTPYGPRESQKLDIYAAGAMPCQTKLLIDPSEPREIASLLSRIPGLEIEVAPLNRGRYLVDGCIAIDRISTQDLHRGIIDDVRPLVSRISDLSGVDHATLFIVEGGIRTHRRATLEKINGALAYVSVVHGTPVIETIDVWETVYVMARAIRYACHQDEMDAPISSHRRGSRKEHRVSPAYVLEGIPGVSTIRAHALIERFGTLQAIANATLEQLRDVPHLGPTVAQAVYDAFRS